MPGKLLLLSGVPIDCLEEDVRRWIESMGYPVQNVRLVRDLVTGASPSFAYVELRDSKMLGPACDSVSGATLRNLRIGVTVIAAPKRAVVAA